MPDKLKWIELSTHTSKARYECLSEQLKKQGVDNEFEHFEFSTEEEWNKILDEHEGTVQGIKLGRGLGEAILKRYPNHSVHINRLGSADCLIYEDGRWWPRSSIYNGLLQVFAGVGEKLDLNSSALIVGAGAMARTIVAVLFREGFKSFGITAIDEERGLKLIADLKKVYFGADIEFIPKEELILLPGLYGFIANTTPAIKENELLSELSYFNFFIPQGVALDFFMGESETDFLKEAHEIGATTIAGYELAAAADQVWVKWGLGIDLDIDSYLELLKAKFQS